MDPSIYTKAVKGELIDSGTLPLSSYRTITGNTILHVHLAEAKEARQVFLNTMIGRDRNLLDQVNDDDETILMVAAKFGRNNAVRLILGIKERDERYLTKTNRHGYSAFMLAVKHNRQLTVQRFFSFMEPTSLDRINPKTQESALVLAIEDDLTDMCELLIQGLSTPYQGNEKTGFSIHLATKRGNGDIVTMLVEHDSNLIKMADKDGRTAFHYASSLENAQILEFLLKRNPDRKLIYKKDIKEQTAAHIAAICDKVDNLKKLVEYAPDICEVLDGQLRNVVHIAAKNKALKTLAYLVEEKRFTSMLVARDEKESTPLHYLAEEFETLSAKEAWYCRVNILPPLGQTQITCFNADGLTPGNLSRNIKMYQLNDEGKKLVTKFNGIAKEGVRETEFVARMNQKDQKEEEKIEYERKQGLMNKVIGMSFLPSMIAAASLSASLTAPSVFTKEAIADRPNMKGLELGFTICNIVSFISSVTAICAYYLVALWDGGHKFNSLLTKIGTTGTFMAIAAIEGSFGTSTYTIQWESPKKLGKTWTLLSFIFGVHSLLLVMNLPSVFKLAKRLKNKITHLKNSFDREKFNGCFDLR